MISLVNLFYVHTFMTFCVRLVRCVLDATGMLPSMDDVYVHCVVPLFPLSGAWVLCLTIFASFFHHKFNRNYSL